MPFAGFHGVLAGLLVGIKQIIPDQEILLLKIKAKVMFCFLVRNDRALTFSHFNFF